jgi:hypothetical protein
MNKMRKNIELLAELGEKYLKKDLNKSLDSIRVQKVNLEQGYIDEYDKTNYISWLEDGINSYNAKVKVYKETYGVEFPELQKQYEAILPKINKYLKSEVVNTN